MRSGLILRGGPFESKLGGVVSGVDGENGGVARVFLVKRRSGSGLGEKRSAREKNGRTFRWR